MATLDGDCNDPTTNPVDYISINGMSNRARCSPRRKLLFQQYLTICEITASAMEKCRNFKFRRTLLSNFLQEFHILQYTFFTFNHAGATTTCTRGTVQPVFSKFCGQRFSTIEGAMFNDVVCGELQFAKLCLMAVQPPKVLEGHFPLLPRLLTAILCWNLHKRRG